MRKCEVIFSQALSVANLRRLGFGPFFQTHFIDLAEVENLDVVWRRIRLVDIGMEVVAGKLFTISTQVMSLAL